MDVKSPKIETGELEQAQRRFQLLVEAVTDYAIFMLDPAGHVINWNPGAERITGYTREDILGQHYSRFFTEEDRTKRLPEKAIATAARVGKYEAEGWRVRKDGTRFWVNAVVNSIRDPAGQLLGFAKITRDLTERRAAEERIRQAQKMEAVGQLVGGVAHDFNNLLTVICGNIEVLRRRLPEGSDDRLHRSAAAALRGAERAAVLTNRLLAFARRQPLQPKPLSADTVISGMSDLLHRTLGETILIEIVLAPGTWPVFVDANELENSLLNLAVNARDAMPNGGKLTIEAANVYLDEKDGATAEVPPGEYLVLSVTDTGTGMTPEVVAQAFDPFFTTKEVGQGTGLGLSQVYDFIKQSGGYVKIDSEIGRGTTIKLYLPRCRLPDPADEAPAAGVSNLHSRANGETILVVEDDIDVRSFTVETLRQLGYRVIHAPDGASALRLLDAHPEVTLLFTDVGLPGGMNGGQLADEACRRRAELKVLFASGYPRDAIIHRGWLDPGVELVLKPFTYGELAVKIRHVLDET